MANPRSARLSRIFVLILCSNSCTAAENSESDDVYAIRNVPGDVVLDATDPNQIRIQRYTGSDTQLWQFQPAGRPGVYVIVNKHHGKVLDFRVGDLDGYVHLILSDLQDSLQQRWMLDYEGHIANMSSGKHVDVQLANFTPGNIMIVWKRNTCPCQEFILQKKI